ncbi:MAG: hypothetical protein JRH20_29675 [Deltaproteobacteria bacterium]|nr:hypothetical protein [Deltaproteobacteria bacterium]
MRVSTTMVMVVATVWLASGSAHADMMFWMFTADCDTAGETTLKVQCSEGVDCINTSTKLYGCGGTCDGPDLVADGVEWTEKTCACSCMPEGPTDFDCLSGTQCPEGSYMKCNESAVATLPVGCEQLGYKALCPEATCEGINEDPFFGDQNCGELIIPEGTDVTGCLAEKTDSGPVVAADSGPVVSADSGVSHDAAAQLPRDDDSGGCSLSPGHASASVLITLMFVLGLALFTSRRRS